MSTADRFAGTIGLLGSVRLNMTMDGGSERASQNAPGADELLAARLFAKLDTVAFTIATGCVAAVAMFLATAALLVVSPAPGQAVGPHLSAFSSFWPGYSVSWLGAFVGAFYAFWVGSLAGFGLALFWNFTHVVMLGLAALRHGGLDFE